MAPSKVPKAAAAMPNALNMNALNVNMNMSMNVGATGRNALNLNAAGGVGGGFSAAQVLGRVKNNFGVQYLREVYRTEGLLSFWKGNWASIIQKAGVTGSNYFL